jgi:hypothetical protein
MYVLPYGRAEIAAAARRNHTDVNMLVFALVEPAQCSTWSTRSLIPSSRVHVRLALTICSYLDMLI